MSSNRTVCPKEFNSYLGLWKGNIETLNSEPQRSIDTEIIFSQGACQQSQSGKSVTLLGKQTFLVPGSRYWSGKTTHRVIELASENLFFRNGDNTFDQFVLTKGRLSESNLLWKQVHGSKTIEWKFLHQGGNRYLEWIQIDTEINEKVSTKLQLQDTHHSKFSGQAWLFTPDGRLGETSQFLGRKTYSPANGILRESEWIYKRNSPDIEKVREFDMSYRVLVDHPHTSGGSVRLSENLDRSFRLYEVFQGAALYSELRHIDKNGTEKTVRIQRADELQEADFKTRLREILEQTSPETILR